jgi:hypothetical protein
MKEVEAKRPASLLQGRVPKMGRPRAGGDADGGRAGSFAWEPKKEGNSDGVLGIKKKTCAVGPRHRPQPVGRPSRGADLKTNADERIDSGVLGDGSESLNSKSPCERALSLFRDTGELAERQITVIAIALERLDLPQARERGEKGASYAPVPRLVDLAKRARPPIPLVGL